MTSKFGHLKKQFDPAGRTAWYDLPIGGGARLKCRHAGRSNKPYVNGLMKANGKDNGKRRAPQGGANSDTVDATLDLDRELFAKYVIEDWENILDENKDPVPFTRKDCRDFLFDLPDWIMQGLSIWAGRPAPFLPDDEPTDEEIEEQAGN